MFKPAGRVLTAVIAAGFLATAVAPAMAMPAGGFHGGMGHMPSGLMQQVGGHGGGGHGGGGHGGHGGGGHGHGGGGHGHHGGPQHGGPYYGPPRGPYYGPPRGPYYGPAYGPGWYGGWGVPGPVITFGAGALIGGGIAAATQNRPNVVPSTGINPKHYQWCEDRYRSYRASDNTFQPYNGPRQQCYSPYY